MHDNRLIVVLLAIFLSAGPAVDHAKAQFDDEFPSDGDSTAGTAGDLGAQGFGDPAAQPQDPQVLMKAAFDAAKALQGQEDYAGAIEEFRKVLEINPRWAPAFFEIGKSFAAMEDWEQARTSFSQAELYTRQEPALANAINFELGKVYLNMGPTTYQEAVEYLSQAAAAEPSNAEILYYQGSAMLKRAQTGSDLDGASEYYIQAVNVLERSIELDDTNPDAFADRGRALLQLADIDYAIEDLQAAVSLEPNADTIGHLAYAFFARGRQEAFARDGDTGKVIADYQAALDSCDRFLTMQTEDTPIRAWETPDPNEYRREQIFLIRAQAGSGLATERPQSAAELYHGAINDCDKALGTEDVNSSFKAQAYFQKGIAQRMLNNLDGAIDSFTEAMAEVPSFSEANLRRGIIFFRKGEYDLALQDFETAAGFRDEQRAMFWSGLTLSRKGDTYGAVRMYTKALRSDPGYQFAYINRGLAYMNLGRYELAVSDFNQVLRLDPNHSRVRSYRNQAMQLAADAQP